MPNHTPLDNTEDLVVSRRQMDRFMHLRPCLRKPCQWHEHCRQLHIPYGELEIETINNTFSNENNNYSGVREMPAVPAVNSHPYAKTLVGKIIPPEKESKPHKEDQPPKTQRFISPKKEEGFIACIQREFTTTEEKGPVTNEELVRGGQERNPRGHGQPDEAAEPEGQGQERQEIKEQPNDAPNNARAALKFYKTTHREIYIYSEPHLSLDKYDASYRLKFRVTFDTTDASKPSGDIIDHRDVGRQTEDIRVVKNNIAIGENESKVQG
jgi:hypothetical protein